MPEYPIRQNFQPTLHNSGPTPSSFQFRFQNQKVLPSSQSNSGEE